MTNLLFSHPPLPLVDATLRDDVLMLFITPQELRIDRNKPCAKHRNKKKPNPYRIRLEEAATYSPT